MKKFTLSSLALLALVGCSTWKAPMSTVAETDLTPEAYHQWTTPFEGEKLASSRTPAQVNRAVSYVWEADSIKVAMKQNTAYDKTVNVRFAQYAMYSTTEQRPVAVQKWVTVGWTQVSQPVLVCSGTSVEGSGKSHLWNAFYGAPKSQKPKALADAIVGIGEPTARKMIDAGYFASKPRSWNQFSQVIRQARGQGIINETVEYQVLYKYRADNLNNLGYETSVGSSCVTVVETYSQPVQELRTVTEMQWMDIPHKDLINQEVKAFRVLITNPRLQSFEAEVITISLHRDMNKISYNVDGDYYTNYVKTLNAGVIKLEGIARKFIPLPSDVIAGGGSIEASNGTAGFVATVNKKYIPKTATDGKLLMTVELHSCKRGSFGKCAIFGKNDKVVAKTVISVGAEGLVRYPFARDPKLYYYAKYWVNMAGSPWYTNNVVRAPYEPGL